VDKHKCELAIVIVNYKTPSLVIDCLDSFKSALVSNNYQVVIVDNNSDDNSDTIITKWIEDNHLGQYVELIVSSSNTGFSGGNNMGIAAIDADYYLLLNSDTIIRDKAIEDLLTHAINNPEVGLISPRLEWPDSIPQESCFKYHTPISEMLRAASTGLITRIFSNYVVAQTIKNEIDSYDWVSFACVLINKKVFDDIGVLDSGYFMYYEDVEFCHRAKQNGWRIDNLPTAHVVHLRGGSSSVKTNVIQRKRLPRYFYESRTRYFYQHYGYIGLLFANILWTIGWIFSNCRALTSDSYQPTAAKAQWKDIWINFSQPLKDYIHPNDYKKA
jgi:hypothetical protein